MKYIKCFLFISFVFALTTGCYKQKRGGDNFEDKLADKYHVFKGTIDEKNNIIIGMYIDGNKLSGYYFFDTSGVNHAITGTINDDNFIFEEKDPSGKIKSSFTARLHDKERFKGVFTDNVNMSQGIFKAKIQEQLSEGKSAYIAQLNIFNESTYSPSITIPKIVLEDANVSERINKQLSIENITGISRKEIIAEIKKSEEHHGMVHGIISSDFAQKYNRENILCLRVSNQYLTSQHSTVVKFYNFDLKTGDPIYGKDLLNPFTTKKMFDLCNQLLQDHIKRKIEDIGTVEYSNNAHLFQNHKFGSAHINNFFIEESTIVFFYDFDFPRDKQDICPTPELTFSFDEIKGYLNKRGPLRFMFEEKGYQKRKRGVKE